MEEKEYAWHDSQNNDNRTDAPGDALSAQVPSSLLPAVLQHLELASQAPSEITAEELVARLKSDDWHVRTAAVRALGQLEGDAPVDLLVPMLDDEDEAVRAATVHALGRSGSRAPLHALVTALHDPDWHVREAALYALGKQGPRIPSEILSAALHDDDGAVREAAQLALRWQEAAVGTPESYGKLWEQMMMQYNGHVQGDADPASDKDGRTSFEYIPYDAGYGAITSSAYAARPHTLREPEQAYAPPPQQGAFQVQEYASRAEGEGERGEGQAERSAYSEESPSRAEKVTSFLPQRKAPKKWWIMLIVATAIIFFILGAGISLFATSARVTRIGGPAVFQSGSASGAQKAVPGPISLYPVQYALIFQKEVAGALHLTPDQVSKQLQGGQSLNVIAAAQGISESQLHAIEVTAFNDMLNAAVKAGDLDPQAADRLMKQFQNNPAMSNSLATELFLINNDGPQGPQAPNQ